VQTALIYPPALNRLFQDQDYHLVLAHLFRQPNYRTFCRHLHGHKILDNGAAEGQTVNFEDLIQTAWTLEVDEIIVPDVPKDFRRTYNTALEFGQQIGEHVKDFKYIGVAQGKMLSEVIACINGLSHLDYITGLALPRNICDIDKMQRYFVAQMVEESWPGRFEFIHCLGSSSWLREVVVLTEIPQVRGIDTSMPVKLGLHGITIADHQGYDMAPTKDDYFSIEDIGWNQEQFIDDNVRTYREWAATPPPS
jgi:hypothetical protein